MIVLEDINTNFGHITITKSKKNGTCTYYQDECFHSEATADGISTCAYVHVMYSIIRQSESRHVLMIGCAGWTLATMLHRLGCEVTVVDINPLSFALARKYFKMPDEIDCILEDGYSHLCGSRTCYDVIVMDAFSSDGTIPEKFTTEDFFVAVKKLLMPLGIVVMNVMVAHDMDLRADRIALNMEAAKVHASLFDWPGRANRNTIVAGGPLGKTQVSSHRKPQFVKDDVRGITRRRPRKRAFNMWDVS